MSRKEYGGGTFRERSPGSWEITVSLGHDPSTGKRLRRIFTIRGTRRDAQKALRETLQQRDIGFAPERVRVADWLIRWQMRHVAEGHVAGRAAERNAGIIAKHLIPELGSLTLQKLRPDHIADLKAAWLSGAAATVSKPLAGATVHKHLVVLSQALDEAVKAGLIIRNPCDIVSMPSVRSQTERRALTTEELATLVATVGDTRFSTPVRLAIATGMRESELLGLEWDAVDFEHRSVSVRQVLSYVGGRVIFKEPKSNHSRRTIELSAATISMLKAHHARQTAQRLKLGAVWQENGLVFPSLVGSPWLPRTFYRDYSRLVASSGLDAPNTVTFHVLRHTAATQWIRAGVDILTVSRRLGHASASFTMDVYGHLLPGQQRHAAEALDHLIGAG